ncbi:hypothetical protein [Thermopolyspora flexuosa]|uniref:Integral membrane protein n=1 Tax=Thermopolyspora flexuosa TaxID=103836 RepID=A0A543ITM4_9ACTN|nr:hypothetical protein [Thermopolyspora flexuosa]TQM73897.1 hypothetical protein FHX40_0555 [Thermopolyspora flexuosa]
MSKPPFTLVIAAAVLALEGLCVLGLGGYVAVMTVIGRPRDLASSIAEAAIGVVFGAALIWVAWGAFGAQRWSRSPGVLAQIFALPVAITLIQSGRQLAGAALLVAALTAIATLLAPPSTRVLYDGVFPDGPAEDGGTAPPDSGPAKGTAKPGEGRKEPKGKRSGTGRGRDSRPR